jgi:hypothetical protein
MPHQRCRAEAHRAAQQAADPQYQCVQAIFEDAAKGYGELAGKLDRIAGTLSRFAQTGRSRCPV